MVITLAMNNEGTFAVTALDTQIYFYIVES